ncbi:MAG: DUF6152 family protein [Gammaproteobacteria bacterium]
MTRQQWKILITLAFIPLSTTAHHGPPDSALLYERDQILEFEGEITEVLWRNPHIRFRMEIPDGDGNPIVREMEIGPNPRSMRRAGISEDILSVGARVRVAGYTSKRDPNSMGIVHLLLPTGEELTHGGRAPRWSGEALALDQSQTLDADAVAAARESASGLFRVWSNVPGIYPRPPTSSYTGYLTDRGQALAAEYNAVTDNPELECRTGMPSTMFDPGQLTFEQTGDNIVISVYEYDSVRTVHMNEASAPDDIAPSNLGYSVGRWDGDDLIVTTTHLNYPYLDSYGTPLSPSASLEERFSITGNGQRLEYAMTATDPEMLSEPVTLERFWRWTPEIEYEPFDCADWGG